MDHELRELVTWIEGARFDSRIPVFPFDDLFMRLPPALVQGLLLHDASSPRVPRRLEWEAAVVSAIHVLGRRDEAYLARAETLPSLAREGYVIEHVIAHLLLARAQMEHVRSGESAQRDAAALMRRAREGLDHAVELIEQNLLPRATLFATLISAGNAWRIPPAPSPAEAIARYERAHRIGSNIPDEQARLAKCHADGLIARGERADLGRAVELLDASLKVRKGGPFESETLLSLADAERRRRRDRTVGDCEHVHRILVAAERKDRLGNAERIAMERIDVLAAWLRQQTDAKEARRALDQIADRWPSLRERVAFARDGGGAPSEEFVTSLLRLQHPAMQACMEDLLFTEERTPLSRTSGSWTRNASSVQVDEVEQFLRERSIANDPGRLTAKAEALRDPADDEAKPGRLVARARALARLALFQGATREAMVSAAREAELAIETVAVPVVRSFLLLELASVWGPSDLSHPIRDFAEAARLLKRAVTDAEQDPPIHLDACLRLARATQHRTDGDVRAHHDRARNIYEDILRRAPALGADVTLASARQNLAALATAQGTGAQNDRSVAALAQERASEDLGSVMATANRAWELTIMAARRGPNVGAEFLRQALCLYRQIPMQSLSESERLNVEHNRTVAETTALEFEGRDAEAVQRWRERLEDPDVRRRPDLLSRNQHNLGDRLGRHPATCEEGLRLLELSLARRPLETAPREHWETNLSIVMALGPMLAGVLPWSVRMSPREGHHRAVSAARSAASAGRRLGLGEELARAGQHLCQLALSTEQDDEFEALMQEGWRTMSDALPCLLENEEAARAEARFAEAAALRVFRMRAERSFVGMLRERTEVLQGEAAASVRAWIERALLPQQRRLAGRFAKPTWCDDGWWRAWSALLDARNPLAIARCVERTRDEHPDFLAVEGDAQGTAAWMAGSSSRGIIALLPTAHGVLAVVETTTTVHATLLPLPPSPVTPEELPALLADLYGSPDLAERIERGAAVARAALLEPLQELVGPSLKHIRLVTGAWLRWLAPSALLPDAVVHASPSMRVPKRAVRDDVVPKRVALLAADPAEDLGDGVVAIARFSQELASAASITTALGKGARWGRSLGVPAEGLVNRPPSPETFLDLARKSDVLVLLAHGRVIDADGPGLELMNDRGVLERLGVRGIAAEPSALTGRHLVLLSCEAGFVEATPHRLGLLLGEFLACGASSVTAASWAVPLESALTVCRFVVHALLRGREPEEGLKEALEQQLATDTDAATPLGRRLTSTDRRAMQTAAARAWVTWRP